MPWNPPGPGRSMLQTVETATGSPPIWRRRRVRKLHGSIAVIRAGAVRPPPPGLLDAVRVPRRLEGAAAGELGVATPYADYLIRIFDRWWGEDNHEVFDEVIFKVLGGIGGTDALGGHPVSITTIDSDGGRRHPGRPRRPRPAEEPLGPERPHPAPARAERSACAKPLCTATRATGTTASPLPSHRKRAALASADR